jgi:endonuclease G
MKKLVALALLSLSLTAFAACEDKFPFGEPVVQGNYTHLCRRGYADIYDNQRKIPFIVFEHLTPATIGRGQSERTPFHEDKDIPPQFRAHLKDYAKAGRIYDRGHLANAQDAQDDAAMVDTMLLSNIVPQVNTFNRGSWKNLETAIAKDVRRGADYYVITGSVAFKSTKTIGEDVVVPTHLFKIVVDKSTNKIRAWLIPNETNNKSYKDFEINPDDLQKIIGVNLFPVKHH